MTAWGRPLPVKAHRQSWAESGSGPNGRNRKADRRVSTGVAATRTIPVPIASVPTSSLHCGDYAALSAGVFGLFFSFSLLSPLWALRGAMAQVIAFA